MLLTKHWILLFYECIIVVLVVLSISEYPIYKFFGKTSTSVPVNGTEQFLNQTNTNSSS